VPATFEDLIRAQYDSMLVTVRAVVRAADVVGSPLAPVRSARLQLLAEGGHFEANLDCDDANALNDLMDDEVQVTGVAAGKIRRQDAADRGRALRFLPCGHKDRQGRHFNMSSIRLPPWTGFLSTIICATSPRGPRSGNHHLLPARLSHCDAGGLEEPVD